MQVALHAALVAKWRLAVGDDDICIIKQQEHKPTDDGMHAHAMVTTQAKQFAGREKEALGKHFLRGNSQRGRQQLTKFLVERTYR